MKRGAEKQLSKNNEMDFEHEDDSEPGQGFRKADESVLAGRKIRGLPKKSSSASFGSAPSLSDIPTAEVPPVPKMASFSGFGSGSNSFTFSAPSSSPSIPSFGTPTSGSTNLNSGPAAPSVSPSASGATKAFASFLGPMSNPPAPAPSAASDKKDEIDPAALKYYTSLRGLNVSFLSAISKAVEQDPFTDVSDMVAHYKNFRISVQKEFDERPKSIQKSSASSSSSSTPASNPPAVASSGFTGFGKVSTPLSTPPTNSAGFTPTVDVTSSSAFTLPSSSTAPVASFNPPKSAFGSTANVPDFLSAPKSSTESGAKSTSPFGSSPFSSSAASSSFGTFGSSSSKPSETDKNKEDAKPESTSNATTNLFGTTSTSKPNPFSVADKPPMSSPFSNSSGFAGFGFAKTSTFGNPVGFGFGSPPPKSSDGEATTPPTTSLFGGSSFGGFGVPPAKPAMEESGGSQEEEADGAGDGATDDSKSLPTKNHDEEGEGEENEETTHTTKSKVYKLVKDSSEDGKPGWKELGVGMLRLKKHKETGSRRVLLRNSSTGKITINFNIYSGLNPSLGPKTVTFVGHDETGASVTYRLRTPTEQHATELKDAMAREIAFVKGDSE